MKEEGILKGAKRAPFLGEPFKKALDRFRDEVLGREDFDPTALLQFGLFMSMAVINILKEAEVQLGAEGQKAVIDGLIKTGYDMGKQILDGAEIPEGMTDTEIMSHLATIINTESWASIEDPRIDSDDKCSFDIVWCPLQDVYNAFDCRVQRYLVQGIIAAFRDSKTIDSDYQIEFKETIPAGAKTCLFEIVRKTPEDQDKWETYSRLLGRKALRHAEKKRKNK